jgi:hypothetical protein
MVNATCGRWEATMKTLLNICACGMLALVVTTGHALAQNATTAEARLKEKNIILPVVPPPVANYVDSVQVGKLLFLSGKTPLMLNGNSRARSGKT